MENHYKQVSQSIPREILELISQWHHKEIFQQSRVGKKSNSCCSKSQVEKEILHEINEEELNGDQIENPQQMNSKQKQIYRKYSQGTPSPKKIITKQFQNNLSSKAFEIKNQHFDFNIQDSNTKYNSKSRTYSRHKKLSCDLTSSLTCLDQLTDQSYEKSKEKLQKIALKKYSKSNDILVKSFSPKKQEQNTQKILKSQGKLSFSFENKLEESVQFKQLQKSFKKQQMLLKVIVSVILLILGVCLFQLFQQHFNESILFTDQYFCSNLLNNQFQSSQFIQVLKMQIKELIINLQTLNKQKLILYYIEVVYKIFNFD